MTCPTCNDTHQIVHPPEGDAGTTQYMVQCPECGCDVCGGKGYQGKPVSKYYGCKPCFECNGTGAKPDAE